MVLSKAISGSTKQLSTEQKQKFDYSILNSKTQIVVQQHTKEIKSLMRRTAQDIINIGHKLLEVKEQLGHGHFETWLKYEFDWSESAARKFMKVASQFKSVNFTDLSIDASALYAVASPSTTQIARQEVIERAAQGEIMTHSKVKAIISQYKESTNLKVCESTSSIPAESTLAVQTVEAQSTASYNTDDYLPKDSADIEIESSFEIGHLVCVTDFEQRNHKWFGKVTEVKESNATGIEVLLRISLQPQKFEE
ncbi:DUF3102 domain-containing protein [uncultured Nostoc sp.]|uniref:DUF3102 domain-containing protein n=1 Tax=uncultured Nostoc sp. TaxID=340711 RepID=UPI0035C9C7A1